METIHSNHGEDGACAFFTPGNEPRTRLQLYNRVLFLYVCCARAACLTGVVPVVPKQMVAEFPAIPAANGHRLRERFVSDFRTEQRV